MQKPCYAILVTLIGVALLLPLLGVSALGDVTQGVIGWVIALAVLAVGIRGLIVVFGKKGKR